MNPPSIPRSLMTPSRDVREGSVASAGGSASRKPRQNVDERDHKFMVKLCLEHKANYKEGTKSQFWHRVNADFLAQSGKVLAQLSATVGRLVEARRRQVLDWEQGVIPEKPGGELNALLDEWMEFLRIEDGDGEAEKMRQVEARRKVEEARKDARRQVLAADALHHASPGVRIVPGPPGPSQEHAQQHPNAHQLSPPGHSEEQMLVQANGDMHDPRPHKRRRINEREAMQVQAEAQMHREAWEYLQAHPPEPPKRVVVEGTLSKEDWREIMGNDARLRVLETKVDKIELIVSQNNKLLLQLMSTMNQNKDRQEEERVPVHLDAEFERDYL